MDLVPSFTDQPQVRVLPFGHDDISISGLDVHEKYMTYLPHSGFHNQRIALENALVLSILLNRTLIIPPIRLGKKPIRYVKYESLSTFFALAGKDGLYHCSAIPVHVALPPECFDYFDYTHLSWNWLVNVTQNTGSLPGLHERDLLTLWSHHRLDFNDTNSMVLRDESPYHYRFYDMPLNISVTETGKYTEQIFVFGIANSSKEFLHFGTLFGSSRLVLSNPQNLAVRTAIRRNMVFSNSILTSVVHNIREAIGGHYYGAHIRFSDGQFEKNSTSNIHEIWRKLISTCYGYSHSDVLEMERLFWSREKVTDNLNATYADSSVTHPPSQPSICRHPVHHQPHLTSLNTPLYISTDAENPREEPSLSVFLRTFPCALFISDFRTQLEPLGEIKNENDGLRLVRFVIPFLDAMIMGHASGIITTEGSTFGRYVEDVLWRVNHGEDIIERGWTRV